MTSRFYCPRCRTTWGWFTWKPEDDPTIAQRMAARGECSRGVCRPWWLRILIGRRWPKP